jgi:hypothetical protein
VSTVEEISATFADRLDMLEESGQISPLARWLTEHSLARLAEHFGLTLTEDNAAQFVTHLAMALGRLQRGEPEVLASDVVAEEVAQFPREREAMRAIMDESEGVLDRGVPDSEVDYMTVHLCALLLEGRHR